MNKTAMQENTEYFTDIANRAKRVNGEWFDLSAEDVAYIKEIGE